MSYKKIFLGLPLLLVLVLAGCNSSGSSHTAQRRHSASSDKSDPGITALAAWHKVRPEVAKWDSRAQLVKIKDRSYARFQRRDGLADVWEFTVDQCLAKNERHHYCNKGKSRTYLYSTTRGGWGPQGVSAKKEEFSSYSVPIDLSKLKIDTDRAVELARKKAGQRPNKYEEFIINSYTLEDGTPYWEVRRQCWSARPDRQACHSADGYDVYVNAQTGEVSTTKPRDN